MNALSVIIDIILILVSIVLIIAVLMQEGQRQGLGAISGGAETFFGKGKAKSYEAKMQKITKIGAVVFIVLAMVATGVTAKIMADEKAEEESSIVDITDDEIVDPSASAEASDADATETPAADATEEEATVAPTEAVEEEATETPVEESTEAPTVAATEAPTEAPTAAATETASAEPEA